MMQFNKKLALLLTFAVLGYSIKAQEMNMEGNSNIEVVFGVVLIILLGMFSYLFYIDRKVSKIEKRTNEMD